MERGERFSFGGWEREDGRVRFAFRCSRFGDFHETVDLGDDGVVPPALLHLLHAALGVSTYKAAAARRVDLPPLTPAGRRMVEALYTHGLAEFFVRSELAYPPGTEFFGEVIEAAPEARPCPAGGTPMVAFGGGKDSYVAGAIVERATGTKPRFASVVLSESVAKTLTRTAPYTPLFIRRTLDPRLSTLEGAFGGHVPITAINMMAMTAVGYLSGASMILFANERSADEPTMVVGGEPANHQYSKSSGFEALVRRAVHEAAPDAPPTYSVLRPFSELWIARAFSQLKPAFGRFTSCNRNFRLAGDAERRWCGACAKCAFTSLVLSPFMSEDEAVSVFGANFLDCANLQPIYRELCGLGPHKPWDCVGTIDECQAALHLLARDSGWRAARVVGEVMPELAAIKGTEQLDRQVSEALQPGERGSLPASLYRAARSS